MGLDFSKANVNVSNEVEKATSEALKTLKYDVKEDRENINNKLVNSKEVDDLVSTIDIRNVNALANFGFEVADEISKSSDVILKQANIYQIDKTKSLLTSLDKIMRKIDFNEINREPGALENIFNSVRDKLDKLLNKYNKMGQEIDNVYVQLKLHENEILESNKLLKDMFDTNVKYYHSLIKYILAGEQACNELKKQIEKREKDLELTSDQSIQFELSNLKQGLLILEQRTQDLRSTENVAMQSIPMLNTMAYTNINLVRKINSAFIITLPVFKQALAQAILLKKQKLQSNMLEQLDERTNNMLIENAKNTVSLSKSSAELATSSSIKVETLEKTWEIIVQGIEETKKIQEEAYNKCQEDAKRLSAIKQEFNDRFSK
ncbi:MAG: toxic anion resistance protein [Lachnospiraceae bacterium]|nr:toxic anion resistance protein [Lachnospiraceae bacterium]